MLTRFLKLSQSLFQGIYPCAEFLILSFKLVLEYLRLRASLEQEGQKKRE